MCPCDGRGLQDTDGNRYVYGLDLLTRIDGTDEESYLYDGLGSTPALADDSGTVTGSYEYDVFGTERAHTGDATEWSYTGEQHDATALEYLRARYYDAGTGRFLAQDPLPLLQRYSYVLNNPGKYTDPFGLFGLEDIGKCVGDPVKCGKKVVDETADVADATWDGAVEYGGGTIVNVLYTVGEAEVAVYRGCNWFANGAFDQCVASAIQLYDLCPLCPGAGLIQEVESRTWCK